MRALVLCVIFVLIAVLGAGAASLWAWHELSTPVPNRSLGRAFAVARGERFDQIVMDLEREGVINHGWPLRFYIKLKHRNPIVQAGNYMFAANNTPIEVLDRLQQGGQFDRITVVEGWTRWDIADAMTKLPMLNIRTRDEGLKLLNNPAAIADLDPSAATLEGYLFPDTYFLVANSTANEVVADMVHRFREIWRDKLQDRAKLRGLSVHNAVTIASIIETEAKLKEERSIIASVIENRLKKGMPLSMDCTLVYASKLAGAWRNDGKVYQSDIDRQSPYNTRKNAGLPPGPVGSPGLSSLMAAVSPASTNYLYYVRNPDRNDGAHSFFADEKGFDVAVQLLRAWEKSRRPVNRINSGV